MRQEKENKKSTQYPPNPHEDVIPSQQILQEHCTGRFFCTQKSNTLKKQKKRHSTHRSNTTKCAFIPETKAPYNTTAHPPQMLNAPNPMVPSFVCKLKPFYSLLIATDGDRECGIGAADRGPPGNEKESGCAGGGKPLPCTEAGPWHSQGSHPNPTTGPKFLLLIPQNATTLLCRCKTSLMRCFPFLN